MLAARFQTFCHCHCRLPLPVVDIVGFIVSVIQRDRTLIVFMQNAI